MLEQTQNSSSFNHKEEFPPAMISRHNKPKKKAHISQVMPQDYICTEEDLKIIQYIKSLPKKGTLVEIGDAFIDRFHMECLFHDYMKLNGDVISAYIHCIRAEEHLLHTEGGKVVLENTFISSILKRDGDPKMDQISYKEDKIASMIFLPINIAEKHWYLAVINGHKLEIHVLDSIGKMDCSDLTITLAGLERHIELAAEHNELKQHKWRDLEVASWPVIEVFQQPMQTDGASCGLWMITYMEYWTGSRLSDTITQDDIKKFRFKLPAILWASRLNTKKGCQVQEQINEESDSASDIEIIDAPNVISVPSTITQVVESIKAPCILSRGLSPTKRWELLDALCGYIMLIDDAGSLDLHKLQDILDVNKPMDHDCFNMAIRMLARDEGLFIIDDKMHYMDLKFWSIIQVTRDPRDRAKCDVKELAKLFEEWPDMGYCISDCKNILLPYSLLGHFILFILDMDARRVLILDPLHPPNGFNCCHPAMYYIHKLHYIANNVNLVMEVLNPAWNDDIYVRSREVPTWVPKTEDRNMTGFYVFNLMHTWNGCDNAEE
ncbi:hypothetical protein ACP4OV_001452 [Aristida adscensionis]